MKHLITKGRAAVATTSAVVIGSFASAQAFDGTELADVIVTQGLLLAAGVALVIAAIVFLVGRRAARMAAR